MIRYIHAGLGVQSVFKAKQATTSRRSQEASKGIEAERFCRETWSSSTRLTSPFSLGYTALGRLLPEWPLQMQARCSIPMLFCKYANLSILRYQGPTRGLWKCPSCSGQEDLSGDVRTVCGHSSIYLPKLLEIQWGENGVAPMIFLVITGMHKGSLAELAVRAPQLCTDGAQSCDLSMTSRESIEHCLLSSKSQLAMGLSVNSKINANASSLSISGW